MEDKSGIINALILIDGVGFFGYGGENSDSARGLSIPGYDKSVKGVVKKLLESGVRVELEEIIDCATETFHRTGRRVFDLMIYISERPIKEFWQELGDNLREKISEQGIIIDYFNEVVVNELLEVDSDLPDWVNEKIIIGAAGTEDRCEEVIESLYAEIFESMRNCEDLRSEMLVKVLCLSGRSEPQRIIESFNFHPRISDVVFRIGEILSNDGSLVDLDFDYSGEYLNSEEMVLLQRIAATNDGISNDEFSDLVSNYNSISEVSRRLFLRSRSQISGSFFLSLCNRDGIIGSGSDATIIRNNWLDDIEVLEHWTSISPKNHDSWEILSRVLWNLGKKEECAKTAEEGLKFHPSSHHLLRRKAHGHRIRNEHKKAVEIEKTLIGSDSFSQIDTLIYLCRGLTLLGEWEQVEEYSEIGLSIDPEHSELNERRKAAQEKIKKIE